MSKAKQFLESKGLPRATITTNLEQLLTDFAQQTNKEAIDTFQEYTEKAEEIIKEYADCLDILERYIIDIAPKTEEIRMIYKRICQTQFMIETYRGVKPDNTPDHTDMTQDAINEVVIGGHAT